MDPTAVRVSTGGAGGSYDFAARVPDWKPGARVKVDLHLGNASTQSRGQADIDQGRASCEQWCGPRDFEDVCAYCKCAACDYCSSRSGLRQGEQCAFAGQITSCWGAKVQEHEVVGEAIVRLGALTSDKDFGCNVVLPKGVPYKPPVLSCLDALDGPSQTDQLPGQLQEPQARAAGCDDFKPSSRGYPSDVWYDPRGRSYDCWWYEHGGSILKGGCLVGGLNFGQTADQACCACGGGSTRVRACAMGPAFRRRPPGIAGDVGEVSLQFWRAGSTVSLEFTGAPVAIKVTEVFGAAVEEDPARPRWSNSVTFRLSDTPIVGVDGHTAFSFTTPELPASDELRITCVEPTSPLPPPPPLRPPWPPAPPPVPCVLGVHAALQELEPDPYAHGARSYLMFVTLDSWADESELVFNFGDSLPEVLSSWGVKLIDGTDTEPSAPFPNGRSPQWLATAASRNLRFRLSYGPRDYFAIELRASSDGDGMGMPHVQCDVAASPPPPPHKVGCGGVRLAYSAATLHRASVDVSPWVAGALLTLRWADASAVPRIEQSSVRNARSEEVLDPTRHATSLALRLADGPADGAGTLDFETPDDATASPLSLRCDEPRLSPNARRPMPAEQEYRSCVEVRGNSTNTRDLSPARWCHDLPRDSCEAHYYELPDTEVLVRCVRASGECEAARGFLSCVPPRLRPSPPPAPPRPPPAWMELARDKCAYLLRPPRVEALSSASFAIWPQRAGEEAAADRCESAATAPTVEVLRGAEGGDAPWEALATRMVDGAAVVDDLRCGEARCIFRLRPAGWGESSRATQAISGAELPAAPAQAARLELGFITGRSLCLSCTFARVGLVADLAAALSLPSANVRLVEVREAGASAAAVFDVLPHEGRDANQLSEQLASLLPLPNSDLYGGDVSQFVNAAAGLLRLPAGHGKSAEKVAAGRASLSVRQPATAASAASPAAAEGFTGGGSLSVSWGLVLAVVAAALLAAAVGTVACLGSRRQHGRSKHQKVSASEDDECAGDDDELDFGAATALPSCSQQQSGEAAAAEDEVEDEHDSETLICLSNMRLAPSDDESTVESEARPQAVVIDDRPAALPDNGTEDGEIERL